MIRRIITIDEEKCNGCGLCARACHEGAIGMVDGKAKLLREDYCDGLGDCLPACPMNAIAFVHREAPAYDALAVERAQNGSRLDQWPVQMKLVPPRAPYFDGAHLLVAADCTAFAYGNFHRDYMNGRITLIGCPKLDQVDYSVKLAAILQNNDIRDITVIRMEVPCCGGLEFAVNRALAQSGKDIPVQVVTVTVDGRILR